MQHFSQENLDKLTEEQQLVSMTLARLQQDAYYVRTFGPQSTTAAINNLAARKIELEAMIDVLTDHLN